MQIAVHYDNFRCSVLLAFVKNNRVILVAYWRCVEYCCKTLTPSVLLKCSF
jgi:hypothetical protein